MYFPSAGFFACCCVDREFAPLLKLLKRGMVLRHTVKVLFESNRWILQFLGALQVSWPPVCTYPCMRQDIDSLMRWHRTLWLFQPCPVLDLTALLTFCARS